MSEYIFESPNNKNFLDSTKAIVVLPDIYGLTDYAQATVDELSSKYQLPVYMLDYFYQISGTITNVGPNEAEIAHGLMTKYTGEDFVDIFAKATAEIKTAQPNLNELVVIGFCFAGRLAYLAGLEPIVNKIVSFYGAGANLDNFYGGKTALKSLLEQRGTDTGLQVLSFYGTQDDSIPQQDRELNLQQFESSSINYIAKNYNAPHAYFQPGRPNYTETAAKASWDVLNTFLSS